MKKYVLILVFFITSSVFADEVGVILGSTTGLSAKFNLPTQNRAIDMGLGYKMNSTSSLSLHADYLFENARFIRVKTADVFAMYYGLGARFININSDGVNKGKTSFGPRAPLGLEYKINNPDISFFGEVAIAVDLIPESLVEVQAGIGVRLRF
ncbi:MAG: hypothetical protein H7256_03730 [Bdellovibrio sp.]|nr:hypothetical protein [Bdellovibrio sp.]